MEKATLIYDEAKDGDLYPCGYAIMRKNGQMEPVPKEMVNFARAVDDNREAGDNDDIPKIPCLIQVALGEDGKILFSTLQRDMEEEYDTSQDAVEGDEVGENGHNKDDLGESILQPREDITGAERLMKTRRQCDTGEKDDSVDRWQNEGGGTGPPVEG